MVLYRPHSVALPSLALLDLYISGVYYYYYPFYRLYAGYLNYKPETTRVSRVYSVTAVLYLQSVLRVMLFRP